MSRFFQVWVFLWGAALLIGASLYAAVECEKAEFDVLVEPYVRVGREEARMPPEGIQKALNSPKYREDMAARIKTLHFLSKIDNLDFLTAVTRRLNSFTGVFDEKSVRRFIDRAAEEQGVRLTEEQRDYISGVIQIKKAGMPATSKINETLLESWVREAVLQDINKLLVQTYEDELKQKNDAPPRLMEAEALQEIGLRAIETSIIESTLRRSQKSFTRYLAELKQDEPKLWRDAVPQIHAVIAAMASGEDFRSLGAKGIRGGLVEVTIGRSPHRVLIKRGRVPVVVNWGSVKGGASGGEQTRFIEEGISRAAEVLND